MKIYKNVLSLFSTETGLDFQTLEKLLTQSKALLEDIGELKANDLDAFLKLLIDNKQFKTFGLVISHLDKSGLDYNKGLFLVSLIKNGNLKKTEDYKVFQTVSDNLSDSEASVLFPYMSIFPAKIQKKIESALMLRRADVQKFKENLKEEIEFLKSQMLTEKALELEEKLKFHFPKAKEDFISAKKAQSKSTEQKYVKIIERNLNLGASHKKKESVTSRLSQHQKEDHKSSLKLARLWMTEFSDKNLELLLTQLEFLNFEDADFYSDLLKNTENSSIWTKAVLYIKSEQYLEGLEFLEENEDSLLTDSPESIYNYYYTKGLLLLGAGMYKEAEEIFTLIKEQKGNFRNIQSLLQDSK